MDVTWILASRTLLLFSEMSSIIPFIRRICMSPNQVVWVNEESGLLDTWCFHLLLIPPANAPVSHEVVSCQICERVDICHWIRWGGGVELLRLKATMSGFSAAYLTDLSVGWDGAAKHKWKPPGALWQPALTGHSTRCQIWVICLVLFLYLFRLSFSL